MADRQDCSSNKQHQFRGQQTSRDDFISFAQASASYCYQLSLWWWSLYRQQRTVNQFWNDQLTNQSCECVESNLAVGYGWNCGQNGGFENVPVFGADGYDVTKCKDCPQWLTDTYMYADAHWHIPGGEHFNPHGDPCHGWNFQQNDSHGSGFDVNPEECNDVDDDGSYDVLNIADYGVDNEDEEDDGDDTDVEIDDDFRKFLEQSEKHRKEREKRKQESLGKNDDYIEVGSVHLNTTTCAPSEQPGAKRKEEMKVLYGKHASTIMSLETSLQLNYDKNCDMRQPVFWPSIPLKF